MNQDALGRISVGELKMSCKPGRQKRIHRSPEDEIRQYRVSEAPPKSDETLLHHVRKKKTTRRPKGSNPRRRPSSSPRKQK